MFNNIYKNKKVLITGHTGFKGAWLTSWLLKLEANIVGISDCVPTSPSLFEENKLSSKIKDIRLDVRNVEEIKEVILDEKPDFVFHLAAQAIVSVSYANPLDTISTNVMGTAHVLESLRYLENKCTAVIITSDKCYENVEWIWGYKEMDPMGGKDIYSGSKGAAELIYKSYFHSFFKDHKHVRVASARAGNVIGGGDWAKDRIVPDCMKSWSNNELVEIRCPDATRPWQHVLEPLSGYLLLAQNLDSNAALHGESFNFGPSAEYNHTVINLLENLGKYWNFSKPEDAYRITGEIPFHEAGLLKLNCDKALAYLSWLPTLDYTKLVYFTSTWYYKFYREGAKMFDLTMEQIGEYENIAQAKNISWTK